MQSNISQKLHNIKLTKEYRKITKSISVSEDIKFTCGDMVILPVKYTLFGCCLGGPCCMIPGVMIDMSKGSKYKKRLEKVVEPEEILKKTLHDQFISELKKDRFFEYAENDQGNADPDAEIFFVIRFYGLISSEILGKKLEPTIDVDVYLVNNPPCNVTLNPEEKLETENPDLNTVIFCKHYEFKGNKRYVPYYTIDEFIEQPERFAEAYTKACELIAYRILNDL